MQKTPAKIEPSMWRKSSQWSGMLRKHVQVALEDVDVYRAFEKHCLWLEHDPDYERVRDCSADEHYMPTLLAMKGLHQETVNSIAGVAAVDWSYRGPHPYAYRPHEVTAALVQSKLRVNWECTAESTRWAQGDAQKTFVRLEKFVKTEERCGVEELKDGCMPALAGRVQRYSPVCVVILPAGRVSAWGLLERPAT
jgi:hypothetical protein